MTKELSMVSLGEVLSRSRETISIQPDSTYREVTVKLWGKGLVERRTALGAEIGAQRRAVVRKGQFLISRIDARNGACGLVPEELDGAVVSNDFPAFTIDESRLLPKFLGWMCQTKAFVALCQQASEGTTNRVRLQEDKLLSFKIALPSVNAQRIIVDQIDRLAAHIKEARKLRTEVDRDLEVLCRAILSDARSVEPTPVRRLVSLCSPDVLVKPDESYAFAGVYSFGRGVFKGLVKSGMEISYPRLTRLRAGNFVYPKLMAWEGAFGIVPDHCDGLVVSTEFPVFQINEDLVYPEVIDVHFRTPSVWEQISGASTGTNVRRRRLNPADFLDYEFPLPARETQKRLRSVRQQLNACQQTRSGQAIEFDSLLPAVLYKVFQSTV